MAGATTVDGIVSGMDTTGLINSIMSGARKPVTRLQAQQTTYEKQREAIAGMANRVTSIGSAITALGEAAAKRAATTSSSAFSVRATSDAQSGAYAIGVERLATSQTSASQTFASRGTTGTIATGTLDVTVGGTTTSIAVDSANSSLDGLAESLRSVAGINAYVVDSGGGAFRLVVQGKDTGDAAAISFDTSGLTGPGTVPAIDVVTEAKDGLITVGGVEVAVSQNSGITAIPGLEIDLQSTTAPARVDVAVDDDALVAAFSAVVDAYNANVSWYQQNTVYNRELELQGPLVGESTSRRVIEDLGGLVSGSYDGAGLGSLTALGVSTERDGTISFDEDAFRDLLATDPAAVRDTLTRDDGPLGAIKKRIDEVFLDEDKGALVARQASLDATIADVAESIDGLNERLTALSDRLRAKFSAMEGILGRIQAQQSYMTGMIDAMNKKSDS